MSMKVKRQEDSAHISALHPSKIVMIYTDGSSLGNGVGTSNSSARAAAVALLGYRDKWRAVGEYLGSMTNQQAEIVAAAIGLEALKESCHVTLRTDSRYVVETMSGRFRRKANHELWKRLDAASAPHRIVWEWTKGHAGETVQEACDMAARTIAASGRVDASVLRQAAAQAQTKL